MNIRLFIGDEGARWEYLPDTVTLVRYLERNDLIELSKSCKRHRKQLERRVFESLSIDNWRKNNWGICKELKNSRNYKKILKYMKTDLGRKIKFVRKFTLRSKINYPFAKKFVNLLPNIKSLVLIENEDYYYYYEDEDEEEEEDSYINFSERSLITILKCMKHLEYVELEEFRKSINDSRSKTQIFPNSLKSLKVYCRGGINGNSARLMIYDNIDSKYENLHFLSIGSNRMLQNLSFGIPNLQAVDIKAENLDKANIVGFLKSNSQLKKLNICSCYNEEIFNVVLSYRYLEYLRICTEGWEEIEVGALSSNYSIKFLTISRSTPGHLAFKLSNSCKNLKYLELENYHYLNDIDWSKLERRVNILKLSECSLSNNVISEIDNSKLFNQIRIKLRYSTNKFVEEYNIDKLNNYKFTHSISTTFNLKLIN
jgi:hypothetical protein